MCRRALPWLKESDLPDLFDFDGSELALARLEARAGEARPEEEELRLDIEVLKNERENISQRKWGKEPPALKGEYQRLMEASEKIAQMGAIEAVLEQRSEEARESAPGSKRRL